MLALLQHGPEVFEGLGGGKINADIFAAYSGILNVMVVVFYIGIFAAIIYYQARVRNIAYGATVLDKQHHLQSNLDPLHYAWIIISNFFATVFTLGLLRPWAAIRSWRYQVDHTSVKTRGDLSQFIDHAQVEGGATGAEFLDIEGFDFGI